MVGFLLRERSAGESGLVPPSVVGTPAFRWACIAVLLMSATFFTTLLYLPQFFQKILGESTLSSGLMLLPFVAVFATASFAETWLLDRIGMKAVITLGALGLFAGPLLFVWGLEPDAAYSALLPGMILLGVGVGLFYSAVTTAALTSLPPEKSSLAGGLLYMFQIAGGAVGLGLATALFLVTSNSQVVSDAASVGVTLSGNEIADVRGILAGTETSAQLVSAYPQSATQLTDVVRDAFLYGMRWAFVLCTVLAFFGLLAAALKVGGPLSRLGHDVGTADVTDVTDQD
jgi:MFS family permease